jgi:DNA-binding NarL/FixJ family response regulator
VIRVAVADDQALVRLGLRVLLESEDDVEMVGEATDGREAVELARRERPDVVLMDVRMPVMDGLEALRAITEDSELAATRVVVLTTFELDEYVFDALRSGASGFLIKDSEPADILRAIRVVAQGESLLSPTVTRRVIGEFAGRPAPRRTPVPSLDPLTEREREVVALVAEGLSNDEIAERLVVSPATVRTHVGRAMSKLDARDRAQLVVFAFQSGLAAPPTG